MTEEAKRQYQAKLAELLFLREHEGGSLPLEIESAYVEQLDDLWRSLPEHEQEEVESYLKTLSSPGARERLPLLVARIEARTAWTDWDEEELANELSSAQKYSR